MEADDPAAITHWCHKITSIHSERVSRRRMYRKHRQKILAKLKAEYWADPEAARREARERQRATYDPAKSRAKYLSNAEAAKAAARKRYAANREHFVRRAVERKQDLRVLRAVMDELLGAQPSDSAPSPAWSEPRALLFALPGPYVLTAVPSEALRAPKAEARS